MSKTKRPVLVHFNETEKMEFQTIYIGDIYREIEKQKDLTLDPIQFQLCFKDKMVANLESTVPKDLELFFNPPIYIDGLLKKKIFGKSIEEAVKRAKKVGLPIVLSVCFKFLQSEKAFKTVGLFRLNASKTEVNKYKSQFDFSNPDTPIEFPSNLDPHVAACIVKKYFDELPDSITTFAMFDKFMNCLTQKDIVGALHQQLLTIPNINMKIMQFVIRYLVYMVKYSSENKSSSRNLSVVFGPIFFKTKNHDELKLYKKSVQLLVQIMIENYYDTFGVEKPQAEVGPLTARKNSSPVSSGAPTTVQSKKKFINVKEDEESEEETSSDEEDEESEEEEPVKKKPPTKKKKQETSTEEETSEEETSSDEEIKPKKKPSGGDDDTISKWQDFIDQWKKKYEKEVAGRKKDKETHALEIEKMKFEIQELKDEIEELKGNLKETSKDAQYGNKKYLAESKRDYEILQREFEEYKLNVETEILQLKKQHLLALKDAGKQPTTTTTTTEQPKEEIPTEEKKERKPGRYCFSCNEIIKKGDSFMESGDFSYHDDCFSCRECKKIIEGPFLNQEGSLICKPCSVKQKETKTETTAPAPSTEGALTCESCHLEIGSGSKIIAIGKPYHKACFRCQLCTAEFEANKFFNLNGIPVCKPCKKKNK